MVLGTFKYFLMDLPPSGLLVEVLKRFSMRKKVVCQFCVGLPSGLLVKLLKRFSTKKKQCINFLMDLPSGLLVEFLKWFSTRKRQCVNFFDGFTTFQTFGGVFEAIFFEKKVVQQFFVYFIYNLSII